MYNHENLLKNSTAYKIIKNEKRQGTLSHAYLIVTKDEKYLKDYMKTFAKLLFCDNDGCGECRTCKLIESERFADLKIYPREEDKGLNKSVIEEIVEDSFVKPFEADKKVFVIVGAEQMNAVSQNKFLKTLEEPPKNVYILLGACNEDPLLATIKSRTKKFTINGFNEQDIFEALEKDYIDKERLKDAIRCSDGVVSKAEMLYENQSDVDGFVIDLVNNFTSSKQVLEYMKKAENFDAKELITKLQATFKDMLFAKNGEEQLVRNKKIYESVKQSLDRYSDGALVDIIEDLEEDLKREKFNVRGSVLLNGILFEILEEKYKWQKL